MVLFVIVAILICIALGALYIWKRNSKYRIPKQAKTPDAMLCVCQSFLIYSDNFQGLYETMYKASIGSISFERKNNVFKEWDLRMCNIGQVPIELKSWWATIMAHCEKLTDEEIQKRAQLIVNMIFTAGIVRDGEKELIATRDTVLYYDSSDEVRWNAGQKLIVETPCWYLPSSPVRIIEKGYCKTEKL